MSQTTRNDLTQYAKQLRREMTPWERKLWYLFLHKYPLHIYKQRIMGPYIVDFYCSAAKLVIELDGSQHFEPEGREYDAVRDAYLTKERGLLVIRFANIDVDRNFRGVCEEIDRLIGERTKKPGNEPLSQPAADSSP